MAKIVQSVKTNRKDKRYIMIHPSLPKSGMMAGEFLPLGDLPLIGDHHLVRPPVLSDPFAISLSKTSSGKSGLIFPVLLELVLLLFSLADRTASTDCQE